MEMSQLAAVCVRDKAMPAALRSCHTWPEASTQSQNGVWLRGCTETPALEIAVTFMSWLKTNQLRCR